MLITRSSGKITSELWKLCLIGISVYFKRFAVSGFGLPPLPPYVTHKIAELPHLDPSIGFGIYTGARLTTNLDFSNDTQAIKFENVTEAVIQTCPKTYIIFQKYLEESKDEKDFFKRFMQVSQAIILVHFAMASLLFPNLLDHDSNFVKEGFIIGSTAGSVSVAAREMAKSIERNENVDNWTLNFLYSIRNFLPIPFLERLENYLTDCYFEMKPNSTGLTNTSINIKQANLNASLIALLNPNILENLENVESKASFIIVNLLKLTFYSFNEGFLHWFGVLSTCLELIRTIPQDNNEFEMHRVLVKQKEPVISVIKNYLREQVVKVGPLTLKVRKQLLNIKGLKSELDRIVVNFTVKHRIDRLILNLIALFAFFQLLLGIQSVAESPYFHPSRNIQPEIHRLLPNVPDHTNGQNLEMKSRNQKIHTESSETQGENQNVGDNVKNPSKSIDFIDAQIISGASENQEIESSNNQNQPIQNKKISNN